MSKTTLERYILSYCQPELQNLLYLLKVFKDNYSPSLMEIVVFTNGCFDLIHPGHVDLLQKARSLGTSLIVGLNSDRSVRAIKGSSRPFLNQAARAAVLRELRSVDEVRIFDENTPENLIKEIKPDVLVKGGDWAIDQIVGADFVLKNGGKVVSIPFAEDFSTSQLAEKIKTSGEGDDPAAFEKNRAPDLIENFLSSTKEVLEKLITRETANIYKCAEIIVEAIKNEKKIFFYGEGKSAFDSHYFAAELALQLKESGKKNLFQEISAPADFSEFLKTQKKSDPQKTLLERLENLAERGDLLIAIYAEGDLKNVMSSVMKARDLGCRTISLTGESGKKLISLSDCGVTVSFKDPAAVRWGQIFLGKLWCEIINEKNK